MSTPGFGADFSLYASRTNYRPAGAVARTPGDVSPTVLGAAFEISNANAWLGFQEQCHTSCTQYAIHQWEEFAADRTQTVVPMGVPAHTSSPGSSSACTQCPGNCDTYYNYWRVAATIGCATLLEIPFVGTFLFATCEAAALLAIAVAEASCTASCSSVGGPCCPVGCGSSCCNYSETCSSPAAGLCCSPGTTPCGTMCCQGKEVCLGGVCCPPGSTVCSDGTCCDAACGQCVGGTCAPLADGTPCLNGGTCCAGACADLQADPNNCGSCGNTCTGAATPFCIGGFCSGGE